MPNCPIIIGLNKSCCLISVSSKNLTGTNCETDIDECASNPCLFGECVDLVADYQCDCKPGTFMVKNGSQYFDSLS